MAVFLLTDGPRSTFRKAQTKREEPLYSGDYWVSVVSGRAVVDQRPVIALALRVPASAQQLVVHRALVRDVGELVPEGTLAVVGARLLADVAELSSMTRQNYLYSTMEPPQRLLDHWARATEAPVDGGRAPLGGLGEDEHKVIRPPKSGSRPADTVLSTTPGRSGPGLPVALLGGGDYARTEIIPALQAAGLVLHTLADREPQIAGLVASKYGFQRATTDPERAIRELPAPGLVIVATAHDSHATLAAQAAEAGHHVFVEKPPTVTDGDVARLQKAMSGHPGMVEIGYNRRYHPLVRRAQALLTASGQGPTSVTCIIKELAFHDDHWYFWSNQGTRVAGNLCHWIDLGVAFIGNRALPVSVSLSPRVRQQLHADEERVLTVTFDDGSRLTLVATTRGDDIRGVQEQIDIRRGHTTITIDDLWKLRSRREGLERYHRTMFRNKAHGVMYREALGRVVRNAPAVYTVRDMVVVSAVQTVASELVRNGGRDGELPVWLEQMLPSSSGDDGAQQPLGAAAREV